MASSGVRRGNIGDLTAIKALLRSSWEALKPFVGPAFTARLDQLVIDQEATELTDDGFAATWQQHPHTHFWVLEADGEVQGCAALRRINAEEASINRMAVSPAQRGRGLGALLYKTAVDTACAQGYQRIIIVTGNPDAARFYEQQGAVTFHRCPYVHPDATPGACSISLCHYLAEKIIRRVVVSGGTHGNERIGVSLAKLWLSDASDVTRSSFTTEVILANPRAAELNLRYVDCDLNRCFAADESLSNAPTTNLEPSACEVQRAKELNDYIGPKGNSKTDFIIDLHSTTANMGLTVIMNAQDDRFALGVASHLLDKVEPSLKLCGRPISKEKTWSVDSISPSGLAFEVGPLSHGTLHWDLFASTRQLVIATLDYIEAHNTRLLQLPSQLMPSGLLVPYGPSGVPIPEPCARAVPFYEFLRTVDYPRNDEGEVTAILHPAFDGHDFHPLQHGDPVFKTFEGEDVPFLVPTEDVGQQPPWARPTLVDLTAYFIGEAAYYEKGLSFSLATKVLKPVY